MSTENMSFDQYSSGTSTEADAEDVKFDDLSDNNSFEFNKIQILNEELARKNEMINKYTQGYPDYEELHMKLRDSVSKSKELEIQNENLKMRLKQSQNQVNELNSSLQKTKTDYENKIKQIEDQNLRESKIADNKYQKIISDLQARLEKCDMEPKVNDFLHNLSKMLHNDFQSMDEVQRFLSQHEDKYQKELENMAQQCDKRIQELSNKIDNLKMKNKILIDEKNEDKTDIDNFKKMIKELRQQLKKTDLICTQRLTDSDQELYKSQQTIVNLQGQINNLENTNSRLRAQVSEAENRFNIANQKSDNFEAQIKKLIKQNSEDAEARIEEQKKSEKAHLSEINRLSNELKKAREEKSQIEQEFRYFADKAKSALDQRAALKDKLRQATEHTQEIENKLVQVSSDLSKSELEKHALEAKISDISMKQSASSASNVSSQQIQQTNDTNKTVHDELCKTFEEVINSLKSELVAITKSRDKLAKLLIKQDNVMKRLEKTKSKGEKISDDDIIEKIWDIIKDEISNDEAKKHEITLSSKKVSFVSKIKYIFYEISKTHSSTIGNEILAWIESLKRFSTNQETISAVNRFLEKNTQFKENNLSLRQTLESISNENIASYNALRLISFMHSICEQQQLELDNTDSYKQNYPRLLEKMTNLKGRYEKVRTLAKSLRDELSIRLEYEEKLEEEAKQMRSRIEKLVRPSK
ncbi:hypothetical protein TVAG_038830 [Trichomonas vaginalis G3]|uniref:Uncharacterized protein n=1 Tax=Trichomonas vaginalis (strain ATCC PRA-98 / G3) TaxID=412133 RepID=A2E5J6_TRIV3|nr:hypothetical protein TVAGG3_0240310 [Trichomonas vaginalis G3]EAY12037.1 hypothetical protein TVAG_038830 [Trichomonas vaginalis G3]KAI5553279.1 hypothetical protein TVAGG3_0240310 [Trichomonas vaginalis G3]|eukprot:XP_001324260.1 hypothetical protein [Trichomonas vaginalis G3]